MLAAQSSICQKVPSPFVSRGCPAAVRQNLNRRAVKVAAKTLTIAEPVTEATFPELVLKSDVPVLIDFWAPWCGPCRMIAPIIDEIASEYQGKMRCYKLNTDESPKIAAEYGVRSIPTVLILKDGKKLETIIGALPKQAIVKSVDKYL